MKKHEMSRYIDADALESELFRDGIAGIFLNYPRRTKFTIGEIRGMLKNERIAPTADVVEVRHGEWKKVSEKYPRYVCTCCNHLYNNKEYGYCPNCGAKMDGERKDGNE